MKDYAPDSRLVECCIDRGNYAFDETCLEAQTPCEAGKDAVGQRPQVLGAEGKRLLSAAQDEEAR